MLLERSPITLAARVSALRVRELAAQSADILRSHINLFKDHPRAKKKARNEPGGNIQERPVGGGHVWRDASTEPPGWL